MSLGSLYKAQSAFFLLLIIRKIRTSGGFLSKGFWQVNLKPSLECKAEGRRSEKV